MPGQSLASVVICSTQKTWRKPVYSTSPSSSSTSRCPWKVSHKRTDRESQKNVFGLWSVASNSGGKKPNSAKRGRSSGCGVPRRTARRALRPVRIKKVTWLLPTAHAPWQAWATRKVLSIWSNTLVSQGPKCWHVCKSGTKALKNEGGGFWEGWPYIYIWDIYISHTFDNVHCTSSYYCQCGDTISIPPYHHGASNLQPILKRP